VNTASAITRGFINVMNAGTRAAKLRREAKRRRQGNRCGLHGRFLYIDFAILHSQWILGLLNRYTAGTSKRE
jgi:hypothetical protein